MGEVENGSKVVQMDMGAMPEAAPKANQKIPYEDLERIASQLSGENNSLYARVQELQLDGMFKRLDYLFRVLQLSDKGVFDADFVEKAADEIEAMMTLEAGETEEQ